MFTAAKVGDEVGFARCTQHGYQCSGFATVTKVNGHGHITLDNGKVFNKHGTERNSTFGTRLIDAEHLRTALARTEAARRQAHAVRQIELKLKDMWSFSGTVHVTPERKAELMALVEAL